MDVLRRWFSDARPIDWLLLIVDFLVLVAILVLELPDWLHKRRAETNARALAPFLDRGRVLQSSVPFQTHSPGAEMQQWAEKVELWSSETQGFLAGLSPRASTTFTHIVNAGEADRDVRRPDGSMFHVSGHYGDVYQVLQVKLSNLQRILENPTAYF